MPARPDPNVRQGAAAPQTAWLRARHQLYVILEAGKTGDLSSLVFDGFMVLLILANVVAYALETVDDVQAVYGYELAVFDVISIAIFTVEYLVRVWVCVEHHPLRHMTPWRARLRWVWTPAMIIDFMVIAPFYLSMFVALDLRILRVFRLLRFLKLARYSPALGTLGRVLFDERRAIAGALIIMGGLLICSAAVIYGLEKDAQPEAFGNLPQAMWWALATLTTVGYGDVVPVTMLGRMFGGLVMIFGLGMFALPVAIISTGFAREIHRREFVVSWGMVARVPLFQGLPPAALGEVMQLLQSRVYQAQAVVAHKGDDADGMYFIVAGRVRMNWPDGPVDLGEGEFFGEIALLDRRERSATIVAVTRCHLLKLPKREFERFIERNPEAHNKIMEVARARMMRHGKTDEMDVELAEERRIAEETRAGD